MAASWNVTGQTADQFEYDGSGNPVSGYRVSFITGNGHRGNVFVPDDHYNADHVRTLIQGKADTVDSIAALSSGS